MTGSTQIPCLSIRVAVADATRMNSQLIVSALRRLQYNFEVHALASDSTLAFRELQNDSADVAVISARLEDGPLSGFRVLHQLHTSPKKIPAVMLLDSADRFETLSSMRFAPGLAACFAAALPSTYCRSVSAAFTKGKSGSTTWSWSFSSSWSSA